MSVNILIKEIEAMDENYQNIFQTLLSQCLDNNFKENCEKTGEILEKRIIHHNCEIEKICSHDYQGFVDSIHNLLHVRTQTKKLGAQIISLNKELGEVNKEIIQNNYELMNVRKVKSNVNTTIETLSLCMLALQCYSRLLKQVNEKRYFVALKTIEVLENEHITKIKNYHFATAIAANIPKLKKEIKSLDSFSEFLDRVRDYSHIIGERALKHTKESQNRNLKTVIAEHAQILEESSMDEEDLCAEDMIDFSQIYRCLYIFTVLDDKEYFVKYYQKQRKDQLKFVVQTPEIIHLDSLDEYKKYIYSIVGFFIVEDHVMNTTNGEIITRSFLENLWNVTIAKTIDVLNMSTSSCTDPNILLGIKNLIMLSITTLKYHGYSVAHLFDFLLDLRDHYNEVLLRRWVIEFRDILSNCDFLPLLTRTAEEYEHVLNRFPFHSDQLELQPFPKKFPFSSMVPEVYQQTMEFMFSCMKFSERLTLSPNEVATMVRKAVNLLLTKSFSGCLSIVFKSPSSSLALQQVIQIIIDTQYLEKASTFLEEFVCKVTCTQHQQSMEMFQMARSEAEEQVSIKICSKLDEFFNELESYNWLLMQPIGHASPFISDMISFLQSTFESFSLILPNVAIRSCKLACEHIANSIYKLLITDDVKQITIGAINQISLDLMHCELFTARVLIPGLKENELSIYFSELRQLLDLLILEEWSVYLHDFGKKENRYSLVKPSTVILMLEKMRKTEKKKMFSVLKKSKRDKKKLLETVIKQLRQLCEQQKI